MNGREIIDQTRPFFEWLANWYDHVEAVAFDDLVRDPSRTAILATDLIVGFCSEGALASERVNAVVPANVELFTRAHRAGVTRYVLTQDTHQPDAPEFAAWPPHCIRGTRESRTVPELESLPFSGEFTVFEKNALSPGVGTEFERWLDENDEITTYVVTGDCTDLCVYQLAMFVRIWANASNRPGKDVIVDAQAVQTYDLPVDVAAGDAFPHPGDFHHMFFLYHMALNGMRIVSEIT